MKKIEREQLIEEMKVIYSKVDRMPKIKEWRELNAAFSIDALMAEFGTWTKAWEAIGITSELSSSKKKQNIIDDLKIAFSTFTDSVPTVGDLISLSGHNRSTIMRYFSSVDEAFKIAKIDLSKKISDQALLDAFKEVYDKLGKIPTEKEIKNLCKFSVFTYYRRFESIDNVINKLGLKREEAKLKNTEQDLLDDLAGIYKRTGSTPTLLDVKRFGKYSPDTYSRMFGGFSQALQKLGLTALTCKKVNSKCEHCGIVTVSMQAHYIKSHPDKFREQEQIVIEMFKSGMSNRKIVLSGKTIFNGTSNVNRIVHRYLAPEEINAARIAKIKNTLKNDYDSGKYEWINEINRNRNITPEAKIKNTIGLKKAYEDGSKISWNKGLTKETDERVATSSENISESMKDLFSSGELEKQIGPNASNWNENRDEVSGRYRLGLNFSVSDRRNIKKRAEYKCQKCGKTQEELESIGQHLECDHILAIKDSGNKDWETNGQALCPTCHKEKTFNNNEEEELQEEIEEVITSEEKLPQCP